LKIKKLLYFAGYYAENTYEINLYRINLRGAIMKRFFSIILVFIPMLLLAQNSAQFATTNSVETIVVPTEVKFNERFKISPIYFNKLIDPAGLGEILEVEMMFENLTDQPMDLNVITIATIEHPFPDKFDSSFEVPLMKTDIIKYLDASPDAENFKYPLKDESGNVKKDYFGKDMFEYKKIPQDPKKANLIKLDDTRMLRTYHISKYRRKYEFFNAVAILIFNTEGQPVFSSYHSLDKKRR